QHAGVRATLRGVGGHVPSEEPFVVLRPDETLFVEGTDDSDGPDPELKLADLLLVRGQRLDPERQLVRAGLPLAVELEPERLAPFASELPTEQRLPVGFEREAATVV